MKRIDHKRLWGVLLVAFFGSWAIGIAIGLIAQQIFQLSGENTVIIVMVAYVSSFAFILATDVIYRNSFYRG